MSAEQTELTTHPYSRKTYILRAVEFFLLCIVLPTIIIYFVLAKMMFTFLWATCFVTFLIYCRTAFKDWKTLWKWHAVTKEAMIPILKRWIVCTIGMFFIALFLEYAAVNIAFMKDVVEPDRLFRLLIDRPHVVAFLIFLYPILSALPQEFIFCTYFFERFKPLFSTEKAMIIASSIVFAYAHVLYINPIAPTLSLVGGYIFATTYAQTKSLALVTIEHGLYGNSLFVIGLGWYFFGGAVATG